MNKPVIESKIVPPSDVVFIQYFANQLGKSSEVQGFSHFTEESFAGIFATEIGVIVRKRPFPITTLVAVREDDNTISWSIRGYNNSNIPGVAQMYPTAAEALYAAQSYMVHMSCSIANQKKDRKESGNTFQEAWWEASIAFRVFVLISAGWIVYQLFFHGNYRIDWLNTFGPPLAVFGLSWIIKSLIIGKGKSDTDG